MEQIKFLKEVLWDKWKDPELRPNDDDDEDSYERKTSRNSLGPCIIGPQGLIPVNDHNLPGKNYNFWNLHTNFDIDADTFNLLDSVTGVETLDVFSRYRVRIAIGRLFDEEDVKENIEKTLGVSK